MENLSSVGRILHDAINKQVFLETVILKAMRIAHSVKISDLIARLNYLRKAGDLKFLDQIPAAPATVPKTVVTPVAVPVSEEETVTETVTVEKQIPADPKPQEKMEVKQEEKIEAVEEKTEVQPAPASEPKVEIKQELEVKTQEAKLEVEPEIKTPIQTIQSEPEKEPETEQELGFTPMPEPESAKDEYTANGLWQKIISYLKSDSNVDPVIMHYMNEGNPQKFENSMLSVEFYEEFEPEHFAAVKKILPSIHVAIQSITNDWAANVDLEHKKGVPAFHKKSTNEIPEPEPEELALSGEDTDPLAILPEDSETIEKTEDALTSIIGDKEMVEKIKNRAIVRDSLDLFGGAIVDIHG
jgi:hypothetical protein